MKKKMRKKRKIRKKGKTKIKKRKRSGKWRPLLKN
jgi:hypothetical protein